jgi:cation diffusion facilitator CzcD-associated flavoprotein CzcO
MNKLLTFHATGHLKRQVKDPKLQRKLTPDYKLGCKRILVSDDFYKAFNLPNVHLVTDSIGHIMPAGIETKNGKLTGVDLIVMATGFDVAAALGAVEIEGLNGHTLHNDHKQNIEAYKGMTAANYPNFSFIMGPNSGIGHISVIHMIESEVAYLVKYWKALVKGNSNSYLDVKPEVQKQYNDELKAVFGKTTWASGCKSWYLADDGRNFTLFPELAYRYRQKTKNFDIGDYKTVSNGQ